MELFEIVALLLSLSAAFAYINAKFLKLPTTIGIMVLALGFSVALLLVGLVWPAMTSQVESIVAGIDFNKTLMQGMLGFLLFAGALHVNWSDLDEHKWLIACLATVGVLLSTLIVGLLAWAVFLWLGIPVSLIYCLLFGALISPTDPIAVLAILKQAAAPKSLEIKISGESLFNDGVGVVVFLGLLEIATGEHGLDLQHLSLLFLQEAVGGALFGVLIGLAAYYLLRSIDIYQVEILISLAVAAGGYALAMRLHLSGPIAMVAAGLILGNEGRAFAMSPTTSEHLDTFWELIDEILNAVLFVLIGLELIVVRFTAGYAFAGLLMIPVVLLARLVSVALPVKALGLWRDLHPRAIEILTWGGLRGGISVALAMSIPKEIHGHPVAERDPLLAVTYIVVVFSIIVQGLTIGALVRALVEPEPSDETAAVSDT